MNAVIFDMDGLMIDTEKIYWSVGRQMAREFGKQVQDYTLGRMMGRSPLSSAEIFAADLGLRVNPATLLEHRETLVLKELQKGIEPMPGLFEALDQLSRRFKLAIATSAPRRLLDVILQKLPIGGRFTALQTSDDVKNGKPDPEIYLKAMAQLGLLPQQCMVFEDSSNGALAGKRAGAYVIAVPSQYTRSQDFSFVDAVAEDLSDAARKAFERAGPLHQ